MSASPWCRAGAAVGVVTVVLTLGGCGSQDDADDTHPRTTPTPTASTTTAEVVEGEPFLVRTRIVEFDGTVLPGSVLGQSPFCAGGVVRHVQGSPEIGYPAINEFQCKDGVLRIGFGPGADQMNNLVQTSAWRVLDGTGRYRAATGEGRMVVQFEEGEPVRGGETFVGLIGLE